MRSYLMYLLCLFLVHFSAAQQPADKNANAKTKATLDFIAGLPKQGKYLSGQFGGWSKVTFNMSQMEQIQQVTGHTPAILGCDYAAGWAKVTPPQKDIDYSCNSHLKAHSNKKGLVTVDTHFPNPVSPDGGDLNNRSSLVFADLLKPETDTGKRWRSYLEIVAEGFEDLQKADVTVLYRPFHEMNGGWFWWGQQDAGEVKNVWRALFDYFCKEKNLHNVLWVYSPDQGPPNHAMYYPGDDYVDIVGLDVYVDDPNMTHGYDAMIQLNKPFVLGEVGPSHPDGNFDYSLWPRAIESRFKRVAYFFAWNDQWSPIREKNAYALFNNPHVVNRDQI